MELNGKVCLIAGASGAIGRAVARKFATEGALIALTYHSALPVDLLQDLQELDVRVRAFQLDVGQERDVTKMVNLFTAEFGTIDVLVNCTGIVGPIGAMEAVNVEKWVETIRINLLGCFYMMKAVLPVMKKQGHGKIINFSGGGAAYARPYFSAYSAAKAAVVRLTETLAGELETSNIQVNSIAPGPVNSRMWDEMRVSADQGGPGLLKELTQMETNGGVSPDRAAELALFLASSRSGILSGRLISAIWDNWNDLEARLLDVMNSEAGTLRRIPLG